VLTVPQCLTCILGDMQSAAEQVTADPALRLAATRRALAYMAEHFDGSEPPSTHITAVHRIVKDVTGTALPFAERRAATNRIGLAIRARLAEQAESLDERSRFRLLATWALAANSLDSRTAGHGYSFDPAKAYEYIEAYLQRGLAVDQIDLLMQTVKPGLRLLYIHDNVGEIVLDGLFIRELRARGAYVTSAVRGGPITSDATWDDAMAVGLDRDVDELILAGPDTLGISFKEMSPELRAALQDADLVISKGQANYYVFSAYRDQAPGKVFGLFTIKCEPVAAVWGVPSRSMIAAFL
jgi:damage-control phosphatase, subfamily I